MARTPGNALAVAHPPPARRIRRWLRRYLLAEVVGAVLAVAAMFGARRAGLAFHVGAMWGSIAEAVGFYGVLLVRHTAYRHRAFPQAGKARVVALAVRDMAVEFGPAEIVDTLLSRPALLYTGVLLIPDMAAGTVAGKLAADLVFYCVVAPCHTLRDRWFPVRAGKQDR